MEVVAVSWGQPQWIDINGVRTRTSIIHTISDQISLQTKGAIEGNNTAVHEAPVYAFFTHHYDYWRQKLGIPEEEWNWCHWGENITFRTDQYTDEKEFNLGDVWKIGRDVLLQVCGARVPCYKLAWRCGQKDKWLKELADTGFSGVYLRILEGGVIRPGDRAELVQKFKNTTNVAQISQLAFDNRLETRDTLNLIAQEPDLLSMNRDGFLRKLSQMHDEEQVGMYHWKGWRVFRAARIVQECQGIKSFYLEAADGQRLGTYRPGQFLTVRLPNGLLRNWSISDWPDHDNPSYYRLSIKDAGDASNWMHTKCSTSTKLFVRAPAGRFVLDWSPMFPTRQVYLSAGIGITPMIAMLKAHLKHYSMRRAPAIWIHVASNTSSYPSEFLQEVLDVYNEDLRKKNILQIFIFYTKSTALSENLADRSARDKSDQGVPIEDTPPLRRARANNAPAELDLSDLSDNAHSSDRTPRSLLDDDEISSMSSSQNTRSSQDATSPDHSVPSEDKFRSPDKTCDEDPRPINQYLQVINGRRPDLEFLSSLLSPSYYFDPLQTTPIEVPGPGTTTAYICGPSSFEEAMKSHLHTIGIPEPLIRSESFSASGNVETSTTTVQKASVKFTLSNLTANWTAPETESPRAKSLSLLEFAEKLGLEPNYGCRAGQCGSCRVGLLNGSVTAGAQPDGGVLLCQARPASELLELEL